MKKIIPWITSFFCLQIVFAMYLEISRLNFKLSIYEKEKNITNDQIEELMYVVNNLKIEKENIATKSFIAGVVETIKDNAHYDAIWHDGYNSGGAVLEYTSEMNEAKAVIDIYNRLSPKK
jgi:dihydroorotase